MRTVPRRYAQRVNSSVKTTVTDEDPREYVESLPWPRRVVQGRELLRIFGEVTGVEPRMWGPSMIGYGHVHYRYASGHSGETFVVGFSPRKAALSLYGVLQYGEDEESIAQLGTFRAGKSCVYVNKLEDIDEDVLRALLRRTWEASGGEPVGDGVGEEPAPSRENDDAAR